MSFKLICVLCNFKAPLFKCLDLLYKKSLILNIQLFELQLLFEFYKLVALNQPLTNPMAQVLQSEK